MQRGLGLGEHFESSGESSGVEDIAQREAGVIIRKAGRDTALLLQHSLPRSCVQRTRERNDMPSRFTLERLVGMHERRHVAHQMSPISTMRSSHERGAAHAVGGVDLDRVVARRRMDAEPRGVALAQRDVRRRRCRPRTPCAGRRPAPRPGNGRHRPRASTTLRESGGADAGDRRGGHGRGRRGRAAGLVDDSAPRSRRRASSTAAEMTMLTHGRRFPIDARITASHGATCALTRLRAGARFRAGW